MTTEEARNGVFFAVAVSSRTEIINLHNNEELLVISEGAMNKSLHVVRKCIYSGRTEN